MSNLKYSFMEEAIAQARETAWNYSGYPVGALLVADGKIIEYASNQTNKGGGHAEVELFKKIETSDLSPYTELTLYTTIIPCSHCLEIAISYGIKDFIYGTTLETSNKFGAKDLIYNQKDYPVRFTQVMEEECDRILSDYKNNIWVNKVYSEGNQDDLYWMNYALKLAKTGMNVDKEIPVAVVITLNNELLSESITRTYTKNSPIAMGDYEALLLAERGVYNKPGRLVMYSTLEPHLLGMGAALKAHVDKIVYAFEAPNDGGSYFFSSKTKSSEMPPFLVEGPLKHEQYLLFKEFLEKTEKERVGYAYVKSLVEYYEKIYGGVSNG